MAVWSIEQSSKKTAVIYVNLQTGERFNCGDNRPETPVSMLSDWCAEQADPGDLIMLNGKPLLMKTQEARA
jgi:hypothetical protein